MRNLLRFIIRHNIVVLFLILFSLSFSMLIYNNGYHRSKVGRVSRLFTSRLYEQTKSYKNYFSLRNINRELVEENIRLKNQLRTSFLYQGSITSTVRDTLYRQQYTFLEAEVVNNSTNKQNNYITINKGRKQGIKEEMGVISPLGVVGVVKSVSANFSTVISVLNQNQNQISVKFQKNDYFGNLVWEGKNHRYATMKEILHHVPVAVGDTIVTSGLKLANDFKQLTVVYVIKNYFKEEQLNLEEKTETETNE
jgi:rod shape-determining protein MreC